MLSPAATPPLPDEPCCTWQTLEAVCSALRTHAGLWVPTSPSDLVAAAIDADGAAAFGRRRHELPSSSIVAPVSATTLDGPQGHRALLAFTDATRARHYARQRGWDSTVSLPSHPVPWLPVLRRVAVERWDGLVVDLPGREPFVVSRALAERVFALLHRDRWARLAEWYVLTSNGSVAVERSKEGFSVWAFDSIEHAHQAIDGFLSRDASVSIASFLTTALVRDLIDAGIGCVHVNAGLHDDHCYDWNDLRAMVAAPGGPVEAPVPIEAFADPHLATWVVDAWHHAMTHGALDSSAPGPVDVAEGVSQPLVSAESAATQLPDAPCTAESDTAPPEPVVDASRVNSSSPDGICRSRAQAALPRLERSEEEVRRHIARFGKRFETPYVPQWELIEELALNFDLWVLQGPDSPWPWADVDHIPAYLDGGRARRVAADAHLLRAERLRGLEVMRWAWARSPDTSLRLMDATSAPVSLPASWPLSALCPLGYEVGDITKVPQIGLPRLTSLPGVRGLRPEVQRALASGWKQLLGVRRLDAPFTVTRDGGSYLAVCTDADEFFRLAAREPRSDLRPQQLTSAPFDEWLRGGTRWRGVAINPGSIVPIVLEHIDLIVLNSWAMQRAAPSVEDVVLWTGRLQREGVLTSESVGRVLADVPQLVSCGAPDHPATLDGHALVFSSVSRAASFFDGLGQSSDASVRTFSFPGGSTPTSVASGWRRSLLDRLPPQVERVLVDPVADGTATVVLDSVALSSARARLRETFRPRVEIFAEFEASGWMTA